MGKSSLQQISPLTLEIGEIPFDLYSSRKGRMELICRQGFPITAQHLASMHRFGTKFFVSREQWSEYTRYAQETVKKLIEDKSVDPEIRAKAMHAINKEHFSQILDDPLSDKVPQQSSDIVDNHVRFIITSPSAVENLFAMASLDVYTYSHSLNVCTMCILMAEVLKPGNRQAKVDFGIAGIMHDIGKTRISDAIITKKGGLTEAEFEQIKQHPIHSEEIIAHHGFSDLVVEAGRSHHEKLDGSGYPDGLKGDSIPWIARMLTVVDVYDALTSKRSYKNETNSLNALKTMVRMAGSFQHDMFKALIKVVSRNVAAPAT